MKKVGILTFQYADNYGAVLQCYALQKVLNSFDNCEASVINYRPSHFKYETRWESECERNLFWEKREKFEKFLVERCRLNGEETTSIQNLDFDVYCVGSDQVWNTTDKQSINFFLPDVNENSKKIAYAVSLGAPIINKNLNSPYYKQYASKFNYISVREKEHVDFIKKHAGKDCELVVDPTLLLEKDDFDELIFDKKCENPFIFLFWLPHDDNVYKGIELANRFSRKYGLPVKHSLWGKFSDGIENNCGTMIYEGPEEFIKSIKNAEVVITNSYHAVLFSIQYEKKFYVYADDSMRSRFDTLNELYQLDENLVNNGIIGKTEINYRLIKEKIRIEKNKSLNYLKKVLE